jgi:hypothetical protein
VEFAGLADDQDVREMTMRASVGLGQPTGDPLQTPVKGGALLGDR